MKSLIVFYSYEGNCELVAGWIQQVTDSDILQLIPVDNKRRSGLSKFAWGGRQVFLGEKPELLPFDLNLDQYDLLFFVTPVWAGSFTPAFNTFFSNYTIKEKKIALLCCSGGGKGKVFQNMKRHLEGNTILGELALVTPAWKETEKAQEKVFAWIEGLANENVF